MTAPEPYALRYRLAYDAGMVTAVLDVLLKAVFGHLRRRAADYGIEQAQCGTVTFDGVSAPKTGGEGSRGSEELAAGI